MSAESDSDSLGSGHNSTSITVDAIHPVFKAYRGQLADTETSTEDDLRFHCKQCDVYFPKTMESVRQHFSASRHDPLETCVYCRGPVYFYYYNVSRLVYHRCNRMPEGRR